MASFLRDTRFHSSEILITTAHKTQTKERLRSPAEWVRAAHAPGFSFFVFPHEEKRRSPNVAIQRERLAFSRQQRGRIGPLPTLLRRLVQASFDEVLGLSTTAHQGEIKHVWASGGRDQVCVLFCLGEKWVALQRDARKTSFDREVVLVRPSPLRSIAPHGACSREGT